MICIQDATHCNSQDDHLEVIHIILTMVIVYKDITLVIVYKNITLLSPGTPKE